MKTLTIVRNGTADVGVNVGQTLVNHFAVTYPRIFDVLLELVQNALDEKAHLIRVFINYKMRIVSVRDDGRGTTIERFNEALKEVATPGKKRKGSLGQFGIGLVSPLGKCRVATFTSCPEPHKVGFHQWTFDTENILARKQNLQIPLKYRDDLSLEESPTNSRFKVDYRSEMRLEDITTDRMTSRVDMDEFVSAVLSRFGQVMRRNKVTLSVKIVDDMGHEKCRDNITAPDFQGNPLPEYKVTEKDAGRVTFRLFVTKRNSGIRSEGVIVGVEGEQFTFPFHLFSRAVSGVISADAIEALKSGLFEGVIKGQKVKLHSGRQAFEKNDAFTGFCVAIEEWWDDCGSRHAEEVREAMKDSRFQNLGLRSMEVLKHLLSDPRNSLLRDVLKTFSQGTVGTGHTPRPKPWVAGQQGQTSLTIAHPPGSNDGKCGGQDHKMPMLSKGEHHPLSVAGPEGRRRTIVRNDSLGLQFAHEAMQGSSELWSLDTEQGILIFNIRHPLWVMCDEKGDGPVMKLQEMIAIEALTLLAMPETQHAFQGMYLREMNPVMVSWLLMDRKPRKTKS
ncbi:MAG: ATP-binding protein [Candidatus Paceibacterota bacterium]